MLKCRDVAQRASHVLETDSPWYNKLSWYAHLMICNNCRRFVRHFKLTIAASRGLYKNPTSLADAQKQADSIRDTCKHDHPQP